jgi:hypothetical protein
MEDKTTLAQKDIRFARTIQRLQRVTLAELEKICIIHLYTLGFRDGDLLSFKLSLNNPSKIAELQELEHMRTKFDIAGAATDGYFSKAWIYKNIFKISDEDVERIQVEQIGDGKFSQFLEQVATEAEAADAGAGADDDLLGDLGDEPGEGDDIDVDAPAEDEDDSPLLSEPPAQRDDDWYDPVVSKKWKQGARKRSYLASAGNNVSSSSKRNLFKGWSGELGPLSRGTVGEAVDKEESLIFETQYEIKRLIEQLEQKKDHET